MLGDPGQVRLTALAVWGRTGRNPTEEQQMPTLHAPRGDRHSRPRMLARAGALAPAVVLAGAAIAHAATGLGPVTMFRAAFTTERTGAPSGLVLKTAGRPPRAGVTEAAAVRQTVTLPAGTVLRLRRLPQCLASDARIAAEGAEAACPHRSRVGSGGAAGVLNGSPVHFDLGIYAARGRLVFAAEQDGKALKQFFTGIARGRRLILTVPTLGGRIAPTGFDARIPTRPGGRSWLRTPARCPAKGDWTIAGRFQGRSSATAPSVPVTPPQTAVDRARCRR